VVGRDSRDHLFVAPVFVPKPSTQQDDAERALRKELEALLASRGSPAAAATAFADNHVKDTQGVFYPLVSHLFRLMGYKSDYSRAGVNYQRWDACVWVGEWALPVEIKSPTEEVFLSTKAIRQAVENKIVLLARGGLKTRKDLTSLIVGNRIPNERGDMSTLIDDVYGAFGISVGVIDLKTLAELSLKAIKDGVSIAPEQMGTLRGFLHA
jgi:hypothetical protein